MKIMKLNNTLYFNDQGELFDTFKEAKENSWYEDEAYFVRKQKVKVYEFEELDNKLEYKGEKFKYWICTMKNEFIIATDYIFKCLKELNYEGTNTK